MNDIDQLALQLFEQSKRFLEIAETHIGSAGESAYCIAAFLTGFSSLEAHVNAVAAELSERKGLGLQEKSILLEKDLRLKNGKYTLVENLKMYRLDDRIEFILANFSRKGTPDKGSWWGDLAANTKLRNDLVHPKDKVTVSRQTAARALLAILECINHLYVAVFGKCHPAFKRGLHSDQTF